MGIRNGERGMREADVKKRGTDGFRKDGRKQRWELKRGASRFNGKRE